MTDTFGKLRDEAGLHARPRVGVARALERRDEGVRRVVEDAGAEHEHEAAGAEVLPVHPADARHARGDDAPQDVEAHLIADVEAACCAGSPPRSTPRARPPRPPSSHHSPAITFSLRLERRTVGHGELARQAAAPAHLLVAVERDVAALHADDPGAQHRDRAAAAAPRRSARRGSAESASRWSGWMSMRNMSGAFGPICTAKSAQQVGLQRRTPRMKKRAEPDGEQDDAGLVAGPHDVQHRLPQRERARVAQRLHRPDERDAGARAARARWPRSRPRASGPPRSDPACHAATPTSAAATPPVTPHFSQSMRPVRGTSLRRSSDGFTCRTSSSGTTENSSDTSTPMASPCPTADALRP